MPSLKKAATRRKRYGGSRDDIVLKNAINFLFQIKGKEYQKTHPEFIIPTADEFLGFVKLVDTDFTKHYKTTHTKRKTNAFRQLSPNKEFLLVTPQHGGNRLTDFLSFIIRPIVGPHDTPCERFFACIVVVLYAVMVYVFVEQSLLIHAASPLKPLVDIATEALGTQAFANSLADPIRWFISHHIPSLVRAKDTIKDLCIHYFSRFLFPLIPAYAANVGVTAASISQTVVGAVDALFLNPRIYNNFFKRPIACYLTGEGYISCKPICDALRGAPASASASAAEDHEHAD
jgi:hypothetical protein